MNGDLNAEFYIALISFGLLLLAWVALPTRVIRE